MQQPERFFFVLPAYNEQTNIVSVVEQWMSIVQSVNQMPSCEACMVIADDGSTDDTFSLLLDLQQRHPLLTALHKENSGHGATVLFLYRYALEHGATYVFQTDSDGQTDPSDFNSFFEHFQQYDLQIGKRVRREDGIGRVWVSKVLLMVLWLIFHVRLQEANTPFRLIRADKLERILSVIPQDYLLSNVLVSVIAAKWKYKIGYHPIAFKPRQGGVNSINYRRIFRIGCKALIDFRTINKRLSISEK